MYLRSHSSRCTLATTNSAACSSSSRRSAKSAGLPHPRSRPPDLVPPLDPLALAIWAEGPEMGTAAIVSVTGARRGSGATTVIATGIGDTAMVGRELYV